jgi:hypothetical protein
MKRGMVVLLVWGRKGMPAAGKSMRAFILQGLGVVLIEVCMHCLDARERWREREEGEETS